VSSAYFILQQQPLPLLLSRHFSIISNRNRHHNPNQRSSRNPLFKYRYNHQRITRQQQQQQQKQEKENRKENLGHKENFNLHPEYMKATFQIVGTGSVDTSPTVILSFASHRYLFNCGEGSQRIATENRIRLKTIHNIFFTRLSSRTVGGLPGMLILMFTFIFIFIFDFYFVIYTL
jgi:hypothetical protein